MSNWWIVWLVLGNLGFVALIVWMVLHYKVKREQNRAEERERLLARFGTGPEVLDLLNSDAGDKLLRAFAPRGKHPVERLGGAITGGLVTLCMGLAFLFLGWFGIIGGEAFYVPGTIITMIGLGILVSAAVSASLLKRSGLLPRIGEGRGTDPL